MSERLVAITMRVEILAERAERRDALDQRLCTLVARLGGVPVPIVNDEDTLRSFLQVVDPSAVVLSGGNDLEVVGGEAPERDRVERLLLAWAAKTRTPVLGICRGMQMIAVEAGAKIRRTESHVCDSHALHGEICGDVPSHHGWCIDDAPPGFAALAEADDHTCEAFISDDKLILGMMWHPERISPFRSEDTSLIKSVLNL
jgi:putative glutamine amidotransferase